MSDDLTPPHWNTETHPWEEAKARIEAQAAEIDRLRSVIEATANHWLALQGTNPIAWEGAIDGAMAAACAEIERLGQAAEHERAKMVMFFTKRGLRQIANSIANKEHLK